MVTPYAIEKLGNYMEKKSGTERQKVKVPLFCLISHCLDHSFLTTSNFQKKEENMYCWNFVFDKWRNCYIKPIQLPLTIRL